MGMVFGKIDVETPKFEVLCSCLPDYEIRKYPPSVVAQVSYNPSDLRGDRDGGFMILANYIGAVGDPRNLKDQKSEKIAMTAPVVTGGDKNCVTMSFMLPSKYKSAEEAPVATDERVMVREEGERKYGVVSFSGVATEASVDEKVGKLRECLERDGYRVVGEVVLARYNPPWTLPVFRTNEILSKLSNFVLCKSLWLEKQLAVFNYSRRNQLVGTSLNCNCDCGVASMGGSLGSLRLLGLH